MTTTWIDSLTKYGAQLSDDANLCVATKSHDKSLHLVPLLDQAIIRVDGPDTDKFLQGQLTCDVARVRSLGSGLGSHCNIKGHMISLARLVSTETGMLLRLPKDTATTAHAALAKYIVFSKAEIAIDETLVGIGITGRGAATLVERLTQQVPSEDEGVIHFGQRTAIRLNKNTFELWLPADEAAKELADWLEYADLATSNYWQLNRCLAGEPQVTAATSEAFIPQMTNLQAFEGVSFRKGCYTGQEIITRLQHRGQLKRPMYLLGSEEQNVNVSDSVSSSSRENIGKVVRVAHADQDAYGQPTKPEGPATVFLAVAAKEIADQDDLRLHSNQGPKAELLELPYTLDPAMFEPKHRL